MNEALFPGLDDLRLGMVNRAWLNRTRFSKHNNLVPHGKVLFHEGQIPPAAMQPGGAIVQDEFENGFCVLLEPFDPKRDYSAMRDRRLVQLQLRNRPEVAAILIKPRPGQQQSFNTS